MSVVDRHLQGSLRPWTPHRLTDNRPVLVLVSFVAKLMDGFRAVCLT